MIKTRGKHFLNDGEENKFFVDYSGGTIYFVDEGLREKILATEGKGKKYFVNKREEKITLLIDDLWK